jgi:hypothetical protein
MSDSDRVLGRGFRKIIQKRPFEENDRNKGTEKRIKNKSVISPFPSNFELGAGTGFHSSASRLINNKFNFDNCSSNISIGSPGISNSASNSVNCSPNAIAARSSLAPVKSDCSFDSGSFYRPFDICTSQPRAGDTRVSSSSTANDLTLLLDKAQAVDAREA